MQTLALQACLTRLRSLRPKYCAAADDPLHRGRSESFCSFSLTRQREEESMNIRVHVWWDLDSCPIPKGINAFLVPERITNALRSNGIEGPVTINAYGNFKALSCVTQKALISTGVSVVHVPPHSGNPVDVFLAKYLNWLRQNPPPMHFFLISRYSGFRMILANLKGQQYNLLLASSASSSSALRRHATIMWPWSGLVRGKDVAVKHFNPGRWYSRYNGVLDDVCPKPRAIPKKLVNRSISTRRDVTDAQPTPMNADGITATDTLSSQQKPDTVGEGLFRKFWRALTGTKA